MKIPTEVRHTQSETILTVPRAVISGVETGHISKEKGCNQESLTGCNQGDGNDETHLHGHMERRGVIRI